ncbi:TPA: tail fiber assembly protein [Citrobacter freundii]|uniref:Phage tail protein n=8 Tax=Citrobacter freundii TaxID=546 RepID=A0AA40TL99_CITFR|nr:MULTISPECIES: tail fiber assembly protein [Enterobacteriaceae]EKX9621555.1 tail fiber assembly protein [Citrobacter freundii]KPR55864.1 phage tail protein [Citrobacter freundii]MBJ9097437.1 tail fiber assembly protein [Citrobacter freundii]MBJ9115194.1 tail fiber assembly protein [Citrobacter freundii]MBJ9124984.1 tail fiber assembly protein [Citrobacter freundii]
MSLFDKNGNATETHVATVSSYDAMTGEFIDTYDVRIIDGTGIPAFSTLTIAPEPEKGFAYIWNGRSWDAVPDYRGMTAYIKESGAGVTVRDIGELAETLTLIKPLTPFDKWDGSEWVTDIEAQRIASIADTEREKLRLKAVADDEVSWRQDAVDAGIAMAEETAALSEWKKYRVMLMRIDTTKPVWPTPPGEQAS